MQKSQVNRRITALRAVQSGRVAATRYSGPVSTDPGARTSTVVTASGHVVKTRAVKMTGAQRNSLGKRSEWSASTEFFTAPAWSDTVTSMPRGER